MHQQPVYDRNNPPPSVNVLAFISGRGLGFIHVYKEELTTKLLIQILKRNFMRSVDRLYRRGEDWSILWDNDSTHNSHEMERWLQSGCTHVLKIPARSPELNICENFWSDLSTRVEKHNARTEEGLKEAILDEWPKTDLQLLKRMAT